MFINFILLYVLTILLLEITVFKFVSFRAGFSRPHPTLPEISNLSRHVRSSFRGFRKLVTIWKSDDVVNSVTIVTSRKLPADVKTRVVTALIKVCSIVSPVFYVFLLNSTFYLFAQSGVGIHNTFFWAFYPIKFPSHPYEACLEFQRHRGASYSREQVKSINVSRLEGCLSFLNI